MFDRYFNAIFEFVASIKFKTHDVSFNAQLNGNNKKKKSNFLGEDNRLFDLCPVKTGHKSCYQLFFKTKLDILVTIRIKFYRKRMSITIKILTFKIVNLILNTR